MAICQWHQLAEIAWGMTHTRSIASSQRRKQVEIPRQDPGVSQSLEKKSHCRLRLMLKSVARESDALAWLRFVSSQVGGSAGDWLSRVSGRVHPRSGCPLRASVPGRSTRGLRHVPNVSVDRHRPSFRAGRCAVAAVSESLRSARPRDVGRSAAAGPNASLPGGSRGRRCTPRPRARRRTSG